MHSAFVAALGSYSQHTRSCITPSTRHCKPRCLRDRPQPHQQYMSRPASRRALALRPLHRRATLGGALVSLALVRRKAHLLRQVRLRQHPMYRRGRSWCRPFHSLKRPLHRAALPTRDRVQVRQAPDGGRDHPLRRSPRRRPRCRITVRSVAPCGHVESRRWHLPPADRQAARLRLSGPVRLWPNLCNLGEKQRLRGAPAVDGPPTRHLACRRDGVSFRPCAYRQAALRASS